jgi:hypothetical protein
VTRYGNASGSAGHGGVDETLHKQVQSVKYLAM